MVCTAYYNLKSYYSQIKLFPKGLHLEHHSNHRQPLKTYLAIKVFDRKHPSSCKEKPYLHSKYHLPRMNGLIPENLTPWKFAQQKLDPPL